MYLDGGFMSKKKLLPLIIELVVILNHLVVIYLWQPRKMTHFVTLLDPVTNFLHLQKWRIDLLFFFKKKKESADMWPPMWSSPFSCGRHKCMVPYMFAVTRIFCFRKNYYPVVWLKQANHQNIRRVTRGGRGRFSLPFLKNWKNLS